MKKIFWKIFRQVTIVIVTIVFVTLAIDAVDNKDDISRSIVGGLFKGFNQPCPDDMVYVGLAEGSFCLDRYEASASDNCPFTDPQNQSQTLVNLDQGNCQPVSDVDSSPWRFISQTQAANACRKAGKRLPTNKEWYEASLGVFDPDINVDGILATCQLGRPNEQTPALTGQMDTCVSSTGAYDMIGNVWEWIDGTVTEGEYAGRDLPALGYVAGVDSEGIATRTNPDFPDPNYNEDYFWIEPTETRGIFRGGYWGNDSKAGIYGINILAEPSFVGEGVGFRCAKEVS